MKKILLVEDDRTLGEVLKTELSKEYFVSWSRSKAEAFEQLKKERFELLILDIGLPDGNGFEIAESFKGPTKPQFLFLTAQNEPEVRLRGFEAGAEDFIPKPFHLKEVLLRVSHVLKAHVIAPVIELPEASVHLNSFSIHWKNGKIEYPPVKDMVILKLLFERSPAAVSRDEIINLVWGEDKELSHRTIDNAVLRLRQALKDHEEQWIRSVRGIGYQWVNPGK
ncbi:MAG: response regulator transcription factor [Pseudobdellovibrionaceae bacterium]